MPVAIVPLIGLLLTASPASRDTLGEHQRIASLLAGTWSGTVIEAGDSATIAIGMAPDSTGGMALTLTFPRVHIDRLPLGTVGWEVAGDSLRLGAMRFAYDRAHATLRGRMPATWAWGHDIPMTLRRGAEVAVPPRPPLGGEVRQPVWTYEGGAAMWAGPRAAGGRVYVGAEDGTVHAIDARSGERRWTFKTGGPVRARPTVDGDVVYVASDDGMLTALAARDGRVVWSVRIAEHPLKRLPPGDPKTRYERFGSEAVVRGDRLYVGTHEGRLLALAVKDGRIVWEAATGDAIDAAPSVAGGRVVVGSFDHCVYAFDERDGRMLWKRDTGFPVVSTPAVDGDRVVIGTRGNDLFGLDATNGVVVWRRYQWISWYESSPTVAGGVAYIGSSDAALVSAHDVKDGACRWRTDVIGWSWGQPFVTDDRVYVTTSGRGDSPIAFRPAVLALDRASGAVVWRYAPPPALAGDDGFPGSPALDGDLVFASDYEGRVLAFRR